MDQKKQRDKYKRSPYANIDMCIRYIPRGKLANEVKLNSTHL